MTDPPDTSTAGSADASPPERDRAGRPDDPSRREADRTERARLATALHEASLMRAIVATATEGIVTIDVHGRIETINRAGERLFGYAPDELVGRDVKVLMPPPHRDEHQRYVERYLATGERHIIGIGREVIGVRRDGSEFPIDLSVGEGAVGDRRFFVAIIRDVTERKELQAALDLSERLAAIGELAAGVAHEVNNPINTILNCAQLIRDGDDAAGNAAMIATEGQRITAIVQGLLQFARGDREPAHAIDLAEIVDRTIRLLRENLRRHGILLRVDLGPGLPLVRGGAPQLQQVLLNLLINAKDALVPLERGAPRRIDVTAREEQGGVVLTVGDTGPGVPANLVERIFLPFVTTKRSRGGTGLGLSISKTIVEGFGGSIGVRSPAGPGAEFRVWLPIAAPPASP